jgi:hypothetical protein
VSLETGSLYRWSLETVRGEAPPHSLTPRLQSSPKEFTMEEKRIICNQCGNPFTFTVPEQRRFNSLGFDAPKRCAECRKKKIKDGPSRHEVKMKYKRQKSRNDSEDIFDR